MLGVQKLSADAVQEKLHQYTEELSCTFLQFSLVLEFFHTTNKWLPHVLPIHSTEHSLPFLSGIFGVTHSKVT